MINEKILNEIKEIYKSIENAGSKKNNIAPSELYNEGWLLRLVLKWFSDNRNKVKKNKISFVDDANWYSEGLLQSPFRGQRSDGLREGPTHADGIYGNFEPGTRGVNSKIRLKQNCKQFVVVEAKLNSPYSQGVTHSPNYNQAPRTVACMCETVLPSGEQPAQNIGNLAFYTFLPELKKPTFEEFIDKKYIKTAVRERIEQYQNPGGKKSNYQAKLKWYNDCFVPFCDSIKIELIPWEDIIGFIKKIDDSFGTILSHFYKQCS